MNCPFCQCEMLSILQDEFSLYRNWKCEACKTMLTMNGYGDICYYFDHQNYQARFYTKPLKKFELAYVESYGLYTGYISRNSIVLELDYLPNINPQNFSKKLPTLLTFL
jgi:hypothetical protein